jgi:WD40 repeat protein
VAFGGADATLVCAAVAKTLVVWHWPSQRLCWTQQESWSDAHCESITSLSVTADGATVLSGGLDGRIVVTDLAQRKAVRTLFVPDSDSGFVLALAPSADGRLIFAGGNDHMIHVWGRRREARLRSLGGHREPVEAVAAMPGGERFVSASQGGELLWWDFSGGRLRRMQHDPFAGVSALAVAADGGTLYVARSSGLDEGPIEVVDTASGRRRRTLQGHEGDVNALAVVPRDGTLVSASWDGTIRLWDAAGGKCLRTLAAHENGVSCVLVTPDGTQIVSGSADATIRLWDLASGTQLATVRAHPQGVRALALAPDGRTLYSAGDEDKRVVAWRLPDLKRLFSRTAHAAALTSLAVTQDGRHLVSGAWDGTARVWALPRCRLEQVFDCDPQGVTALALSPDGRHALCGGADGTVRAQPLGVHAPRRAMEGHLDAVNALAFTPDGRRLVSCSPDHRVRVWRVPEGTEAGAIDHRVGHGSDYGHLLGLAIGDGGRTVLWACGSNIVESGLRDGRCRRELTWHDNTVTSVAVAGGRLATGALDTRVVIARLGSSRPERIIEARGGEVGDVALSADGTQVIASFSMHGVVKVWDVATGRLQCRLHAGDPRVTALAVAGDAPQLLSGSADGMIRAWSIAPRVRRRLLRVLAGHEDAVSALAFDGTRSRLLSASRDGTLRAWPMAGEPSRLLFAADAPLTALAVSSDGRHVACGDTIGRIRLFECVDARIAGVSGRVPIGTPLRERPVQASRA